METRPRQEMKSRWVKIILGLIMILQLGITLSSFHSLADLTNDQPLVNIDFCSQYYWAQAAREFMKVSGRIYGYDPFFMAGYPLDFIANSSLPVQLVAVAFSGFNLARLIKACFLVSFALVPLTLYFSLRKFGLSPWTALAASGLGLASFWVGENALFGRFGMISGAFLLHFFLVPMSLLLAFLREKKRRDLLLLFLTMPLAFLLHKTAFVLILPLSAIWIIYFSRSLSLSDFSKLAAVFGFTLVVNLFWLLPFFRFLGLKVEDPTTTFFQNLNAWRWVLDLVPFQPFFGLPLVRLCLVIFGIIGGLKMRGEGSRLFWPVILGLGFFGLLSYFGSFIPALRHLQPYRYITAYFYLWLPLAGRGLQEIYRRGFVLRGFEYVGPMVFTGFLLLILFLPSMNTFSRVAPLRTDLDRDSQELLEWLKRNTDPSARILIEDINAWEQKPIYGGARLPHLLPLLVRRELIGGPLPNAFLLHHHAAFQDGRLLDTPLADFSDDRLQETVSLYNLGWAVCWSEAAKERFRKFSLAKEVASFGELKVFAFARSHSFFLEGSGEVVASFDQITLTNLTTDTGRVVICYHWVAGLASEPTAELAPVKVGAEPVGFIGIMNPPPRLSLRLGP